MDVHNSSRVVSGGIPTSRLNLDEPRWNQSTFVGRYKHYLNITDARLSIYSDQQFESAKDLVLKYKLGLEPPGTRKEQLWRAQKLYMSAYHPDSGERQNRVGRMSFQVPACMIIASASLHYYRSLRAVVFWQWVNQSYNALVNYTNRNAASPITNRHIMRSATTALVVHLAILLGRFLSKAEQQLKHTQIGVAYISATTGALFAAMSFSSLTKKSAPVIRRYVPFVAVSAAHFVNVPMTRQQEIIKGVKVYDVHGHELGVSRKASYKGITQVIISRVIMIVPSLGGIPIIMEALVRYSWFRRASWSHIPLQAALVGVMMAVMVPFGCALFPQRASIATDKLEPALRDKIRKQYGGVIDKVYFNKGL